jgi:hypothetical protein
MKKIRLALDTLQVESFDTAARSTARGTVRANSGDSVDICTWDTCYDSCGWSDIDCYTQGCRTDWVTCGDNGSCCPAVCW